ncbi:class I SAM-dependent methyltransferase [uncultured Pseudokineococcus sp.]|uniref:class I SAM-dependent methyltransferase n=1 Tax=uncultured Pseudokineococcus sp. TaxID=1642928 RepID=UPI0026080F76|nr:class I SAM-dependent methyltransferase [uncultured Pseudokineococcus sp.]
MTSGEGGAGGADAPAGGADDSAGGAPLERPVPADWLALRETADVRARDEAADALLGPLAAALAERAGPQGGDRAPRPPGAGGPHVLDVGAGTGAGARWLAPRLRARLGREARWTLLDHDADLLARAGAAPGATGRGARRVLGDLSRAAALLRGTGAPGDGATDGPGRPDLATATALLDLLRPAEVEVLAGAVVDAGVPLLVALSVTGEVRLDPPDPLDAELAAAFDAHQRRGGRLGPDAVAPVVERLGSAGLQVLTAPSPWRLGTASPSGGGGDADLLAAWARGRAEAAVEHDGALAAPAARWSRAREEQARAGALGAVVGHVDLLALPGVTRGG